MTIVSSLFLLLIGFLLSLNEAAIIDYQFVANEKATVGEFPWQVSIRKYLGQHVCGGTLISTKKVLTAAYCVESSSPEDIHVVTGATSLTNGGEYHDVTHVVKHENYKDGAEYSWRYDIAILTLANSAAVSELQSPIPIGTASTISVNSTGITSGWGNTIYPNVALPTSLKKFNLTIITNEECQTYHALTIYDDQICGISGYGQGVCTGDSGGPLVVDGLVVGITSWVRPCGLGYPDVFVRVSSFASWILEHINDA